MSIDFHLRQRAVRQRLAGHRVNEICERASRSRAWFYYWWSRFQDEGADGLRARSRAPQTSPRALPETVRRAILAIRDRLTRRRGPQARYRLAGAPTIQHELEVLGYTPVPGVRTIERVLQRGTRTHPPLRLAPATSSPTYPVPRATCSNQVHQFDLVGPRYLHGSHARYYFLVYKDVYDQALFVDFLRAPTTTQVLDFLVAAWQQLGLPARLQMDNDPLFAGTGRWPGSLNRVIRLALRVGVEPIFIPEGEPFRNGSVENFNGWFQPRLLAIQLRGPAQVRRELRALMDVCLHEHIHPQLGFRTTHEVRRGLHPKRLGADFTQHHQPLPLAIGRVTFIRKVRRSGRMTILGIKLRVGKRWQGQYVRATLYTRTAQLKVYHRGRLIKTLAYPLRGT